MRVSDDLNGETHSLLTGILALVGDIQLPGWKGVVFWTPNVRAVDHIAVAVLPLAKKRGSVAVPCSDRQSRTGLQEFQTI